MEKMNEVQIEKAVSKWFTKAGVSADKSKANRWYAGKVIKALHESINEDKFAGTPLAGEVFPRRDTTNTPLSYGERVKLALALVSPYNMSGITESVLEEEFNYGSGDKPHNFFLIDNFNEGDLAGLIDSRTTELLELAHELSKDEDKDTLDSLEEMNLIKGNSYEDYLRLAQYSLFHTYLWELAKRLYDHLDVLLQELDCEGAINKPFDILWPQESKRDTELFKLLSDNMVA